MRAFSRAFSGRASCSVHRMRIRRAFGEVGASIALAFGVCLGGCGRDESCYAATHSLSLVGAAAIDCGDFVGGADSRAGVACALDAQRENRPFRLRVTTSGRDSLATTVWLRTPTGQSVLLDEDSGPCGSFACGSTVRRSECGGDFEGGESLPDGRAVLNCAAGSAWRTLCRIE